MIRFISKIGVTDLYMAPSQKRRGSINPLGPPSKAMINAIGCCCCQVERRAVSLMRCFHDLKSHLDLVCLF